MTNPEPGTGVGNDFPDAPDESTERDQDQPIMEKFAERMGTDTIETGEGLDAIPDRSSAGTADEASTTSPSSPTASDRAGGSDGDGASDGSIGAKVRERLEPLRGPLSKAAGAVAGGFGSAADKLQGLAGQADHDADHDREYTLDELRERVSDIRTVMLTNGDERGTLSSRPVTVQRVTGDGDVLFVVDRDADWVPAGVDPVNVAFVEDAHTWVSVAGRMAVDDDRALLDELWNPMLDAFFPDGRDAGAVVLRVQADRWEYWTAPNRLLQLVEIATAKITDQSPDLGTSGAVET